MAHFAKVINNVVEKVIVAEQDYIDTLPVEEGSRWIQTSYNTIAGTHILGGTPFRGNFAGPGMLYDSDLDAFIPVQPYPSWTLNTTTYQYEAPIPMPTDGKYSWDEDAYQADNTQGWI